MPPLFPSGRWVPLLLSVFFPSAALSASPKDHLREARLAYYHGNLERAASEYGDVPSGAPTHLEALINRAILLNQLGRPKESLALFREAESLKPSDAFLLRQMGWICFSLEAFDEAAVFFRRALGAEPDDGEGRVGLLWTLARQNNTDEALSEFQKTLLVFDLPILHYLAGRLFERIGNREAALRFYERAVKGDAFLVEARMDRERVLNDQARAAVPLWRRAFRSVPGSGFLLRLVRELWTPPGEGTRPFPPVDLSPPLSLNSRARAPSGPMGPPPSLPSGDLRIGLNVGRDGRPRPEREMLFFCRSDFEVRQSTTGDLAALGRAGEIWRISALGADKNPSLILSPVEDSTASARGGTFWIVPRDPEATTMVLGVRFGAEAPWARNEDREYRGRIEARRLASGVSLVNKVGLEDYIGSVTPGELPPENPIEALKAQAVLSRSVALVSEEHGALGYDLCDDQHCQVYRGLLTETGKSLRAVRETRGEVLLYQGRIAHGVYSSNCGGHTQASGELNGWGNVPYWQAVSDGPQPFSDRRSPAVVEQWIRGAPDVYCRPSRYTPFPESRWVRIVPEDVLRAQLETEWPDIGPIQLVVARRRSRSGHVNRVEVVGAGRSVTLEREHRIRSALAPGGLRSTLFTVQTLFTAGRPSHFLFWGGGWGHGVGFCQSGASGMAESGKTYKKILAHFFPACRVGRLEE